MCQYNVYNGLKDKNGKKKIIECLILEYSDKWLFYLRLGDTVLKSGQLVLTAVTDRQSVRIEWMDAPIVIMQP